MFLPKYCQEKVPLLGQPLLMTEVNRSFWILSRGSVTRSTRRSTWGDSTLKENLNMSEQVGNYRLDRVNIRRAFFLPNRKEFKIQCTTYNKHDVTDKLDCQLDWLGSLLRDYGSVSLYIYRWIMKAWSWDLYLVPDSHISGAVTLLCISTTMNLAALFLHVLLPWSFCFGSSQPWTESLETVSQINHFLF